MFGMFKSFHVGMDLGRKEFLYRSVLEYICSSFNIWWARVAVYNICCGMHRDGTSNRPLIILKVNME